MHLLAGKICDVCNLGLCKAVVPSTAGFKKALANPQLQKSYILNPKPPEKTFNSSTERPVN